MSEQATEVIECRTANLSKTPFTTEMTVYKVFYVRAFV